MKELRIGHDHVGYGSGWLLEKVILKKFFTRQETRDFRRAIRKRAEAVNKRSYEYNDAEAGLFDDEEEAKGFHDPEEYDEFKRHRLEMAVNRKPMFEEYKFQCDQWLAIDDDGSGSKTEVTMRPKSSVIMFKDMNSEELEKERKEIEEEERNAARKKPRRVASAKLQPRKGRHEPEIHRVPSEIKITEELREEDSMAYSHRISRPKSAAIRKRRGHHGGLSSGESDDSLDDHMTSSALARDRPMSAASSSSSRHMKLHIKSRNLIYTTFKGREIKRFPVPDEKVPWEVEFKEYRPTDWTNSDLVGNAIDPDVRKERHIRLKFNHNDGKTNRTSHLGVYELTDTRENSGAVPLNPMGRTGLKGRGHLGRWGPNHRGELIVTRWQRNSRNINMMHQISRKPILEVAVRRQRGTMEFLIPVSMADAGSAPLYTATQEFIEDAVVSSNLDDRSSQQALKMGDLFFQAGNGQEVYRGYVDDNLNTDNAWLETIVAHYHDESGVSLGKLPLGNGDDSLCWIEVSADTKLAERFVKILRKIVRHLNAHW